MISFIGRIYNIDYAITFPVNVLDNKATIFVWAVYSYIIVIRETNILKNSQRDIINLLEMLKINSILDVSLAPLNLLSC